MQKKGLIYGLAGLGLFILAFGVAYLVGGKFLKPSSKVTTSPTTDSKLGNAKKPKFDLSLPRTEVCPLNGLKYPKVVSDIWNTRRPLAVMIENSADSRPLSGLSSADIIYEAVAEGGITRNMGIFYCEAAPENVLLAPVRSARIYFTKLVTEYDALYNHVGGAGNCDDPTVDNRAKALCFIQTSKIKDLDQFGLDFKSCHRLTNRTDKEVAYEHTMACYSDELYKVAAKRGWTNIDENVKVQTPWDKNFVLWKFKEDAAASDLGKTTDISFEFWKSKPDYSVSWKYDSATNSYLRSNGGQLVVDLNNDQPITAKDVVIQFVKETGPIDEHMHMLYDVVGTGKMILFQDGQAVTGTWSKTTPFTRTKFLTDAGKEVLFNRGQIWIEIVPAGNEIGYNK